jgi:hypothetical protein
MPCRWRELVFWGATLGFARTLEGQQVRELGVQTVGALSDPALAVAGVYGALRTPGRTRVSLSLGGGASGGEAAFRGELLAHFLLSPEALRRPGLYLAGGIAGVEGKVDRGYLVLTAGVEQGPRSRRGWALELGVGGGVRLAFGYRWRWFTGLPQ